MVLMTDAMVDTGIRNRGGPAIYFTEKELWNYDQRVMYRFPACKSPRVPKHCVEGFAPRDKSFSL
jgi:hypothetical protein